MSIGNEKRWTGSDETVHSFNSEKMIRLGERLSAIVSLLPESGSVADVGTDHGYIPAYIAMSGTYERITASDIAESPLQRARLTAQKYDLSKRICFVRSDGLRELQRHDIVIIAGMGGESIISIMENAPWPTEGIRFILQPQTKLPELRMWLWQNGYSVERAKLALDTGRLYAILSVCFGNPGKVPTPGELFVDRSLLEAADPLLKKWLTLHMKQQLTVLSALEAAGRIEDAHKIRDIILELEKMSEVLKDGDCKTDI